MKYQPIAALVVTFQLANILSNEEGNQQDFFVLPAISQTASKRNQGCRYRLCGQFLLCSYHLMSSSQQEQTCSNLASGGMGHFRRRTYRILWTIRLSEGVNL